MVMHSAPDTHRLVFALHDFPCWITGISLIRRLNKQTKRHTHTKQKVGKLIHSNAYVCVCVCVCVCMFLERYRYRWLFLSARTTSIIGLIILWFLWAFLHQLFCNSKPHFPWRKFSLKMTKELLWIDKSHLTVLLTSSIYNLWMMPMRMHVFCTTKNLMKTRKTPSDGLYLYQWVSYDWKQCTKRVQQNTKSHLRAKTWAFESSLLWSSFPTHTSPFQLVLAIARVLNEERLTRD